MFKRVQENIITGIDKIKWFSSLFSERLKIEIVVFKLLYRSDEINRKREKLLKIIGERVFELRNYPEKNLLKDSVIVETIREIEAIEKEMDDLKDKAAEISRVTG